MENNNKIEPTQVDPLKNSIVFDTQQGFNQKNIDSLQNLIKPQSALPTHIPTTFMGCFYSYVNGATNDLYIYLNNTWKKL